MGTDIGMFIARQEEAIRSAQAERDRLYAVIQKAMAELDANWRSSRNRVTAVVADNLRAALAESRALPEGGE